MRKSLWIMLAVLLAVIAAPYANADTVTFDASGSLTPEGAGGLCSPSGCTLGGDIVINNTTGTVTSIDITVAGATVNGTTQSVGPFHNFIEFIPSGSQIFSNDGALGFLSGALW